MFKSIVQYHLDKLKPKEFELIIKILKEGGIGILPTDTIYGMVGSALNPVTVDKIYRLRKRTPTKPLIILIASIADLGLFNIKLDNFSKDFLNNNWPNPISVILACPESKFEYLHRGTKTLAFRNPNNPFLLKLLKKTGPLVAPSANFEGEKPAETIAEAKNYFYTNVDFFLDNGELKSASSTLVSLENNKVSVLRKGVFKPKI